MRYVYKSVLFLPLAIFFVLTLDYSLSLQIFIGYFLYDIKRILELALLLWLAIFLIISCRERRVWLNTYNLVPRKARLYIFAIFLLGIFSSISAPIPKMAFLEVSLFFLMFCFMVFIAGKRIELGISADKILVLLIILGIVIYEFIFVHNYLNSLPITKFFNSYIGFVHPRFLSQFLTWTLPLVTLPICLIGRDKSRPYVVIPVFIISCLWWAISIVNSANGTFLGIFIAGIFAAFMFRGAINKWLLLQMQAIAGGIFVYIIMFCRLPGFHRVHDSLFSRLPLWHQAFKLIIHHPFLGVGPMHYAYYWNPIAAHPHNSWLLIASEWGIPVLILTLILFIRGITSWLKKILSSCGAVMSSRGLTAGSSIPIALTVSLIAGAIHSLVSGILVMPLSQVMLCIVVGWMLGIYYAD